MLWLRQEAGRAAGSELPITQDAAAKKADMGREVWNGLEKGRLGLGEARAARIAEAFNRPITEIEVFVTPRGQSAEIAATLNRLTDQFDEIEARVGVLESEVERLTDGHDSQGQSVADG